MRDPLEDGAVLVDANIVLYALGDLEPHRSQCRALLSGLWAGSGRAYASTEMIQEVLHHRMRKDGRANALRSVRGVLPSFIVLDFDQEVLELALDLIEKTQIRGRDAVHAATALAYGISTIASSDSGFDVVPGLTRIDPLVP